MENNKTSEGYIYLLSVSVDDGIDRVYKIGKTKQAFPKRFYGYRKYKPQLINVCSMNNCDIAETELLKIFKKKFNRVMGREYFSGDISKMKNIFSKYVYENYNCDIEVYNDENDHRLEYFIDKPDSIPNGKQLFYCTDTKRFIISSYKKIYESLSENTICEDYAFNNKIKLHISINLNEKQDNRLRRRKKIDNIINKILPNVNKKINEEFGIDDPQIIVMMLDTFDKISLQIVYVNVVFASSYDMKYFMSDFNGLINTDIYKKGYFRMTGCSSEKNKKLIYHSSLNYDKPDDDFKLYLDTCLCHTDIDDDDVLSFTFNKIIYNNDLSNKYFGEERNFKYVEYDLEEISRSLDVVRNNMKYYNNWFLVTSAIKDLWVSINESDQEKLYNMYENICKSIKNFDKKINKKVFLSIKPSVDINYLFHLSNRPNFISKFFDYQSIIFNINNHKNIISQESKYIDVDVRDLLKYDSIYMKSPCGTGKTTTLKDIIDVSGIKNIITISSRVNLAKHLSKFLDLTFYKDIDKRNITYDTCDRLAIQFESITKCDDTLFRDGLVILDEVNSLLSHLRSSTMEDKRSECYEYFVEIIKNCKMVVALDADLADWNIQFIQSIKNDKYIVYHNTIKNKSSVQSIFYEYDQTMIDVMVAKMKNNEKFIACFDSLKKMKIIIEYLSQFGDRNEWLLYSSEHKYTEINTSDWDDKYVFYSPSIIYGIDYNNKIKKDVFCFVYKNHLNAMTIYQMISRCRKAQEVHIYCQKICYYNRYQSIEDVKKEYQSLEHNFSYLLKNYETFGLLDEEIYRIMYYNYKYIDTLLRANNKEYLIDMMKEMGYTISYNNIKTTSKLLGIKLTKKEIKDSLVELLGLDKDNLTDFQKIIVSCDKQLQFHFNLRLFLRDNLEEELGNRLGQNLLTESVGSVTTKIKMCKKLMEILEIPSLKHLTEDVKEKFENKINSKWLADNLKTIKYIFGITLESNDTSNYDHMYSLLKSMYRKLFDSKIFKFDRKRISKTLYPTLCILNKEVYDKHIELMNRNRYRFQTDEEEYPFDEHDSITDDLCGPEESDEIIEYKFLDDEDESDEIIEYKFLDDEDESDEIIEYKFLDDETDNIDLIVMDDDEWNIHLENVNYPFDEYDLMRDDLCDGEEIESNIYEFDENDIDSFVMDDEEWNEHLERMNYPFDEHDLMRDDLCGPE